MTFHVVMYSGGKASWLAALLVQRRYPDDQIDLLFADTKTEDEDLYRFLREGADALNLDLVEVANSRNIWEVFRDERFLGNNRVPICSRILKQETSAKYVRENYDPEDTVLYFGIDWTEAHRAERIPKHWEPYEVDFPLLWEPVADKADADLLLAEHGVKQPRLYDLGAPHNNCGGLCVRAGHGHFKWALENIPETYRVWELEEQKLRDYLEADVAILRDRRGGTTRPMTMTEFRVRVQGEDTQLDLLDWGGCGCMVEYDEDLTTS